MVAADVYNVAMALPEEERVKLYNMLKSDVLPQAKTKKSRVKSPDFTDDDALEYLLKHLNINNTP